MTRALVMGHSHSNAIAQALARSNAFACDIVVYLLQAKRPAENAILLEDALKLISGSEPVTYLFLAVLHSYHNVLGLVRSGEDFDFLLDQSDEPDPLAKVCIPHRAMASAFDDQFAQTEKIRALIAAANCPVFLLSAPPPKRSNDYIFDQFMKPKNRIYRGKTVKDFGVERAATRLKLWALEERLMAEWARSLGANFLPVPRGACDPDGFLKEDFYEDDATHANAGYGALVLEQIAATMQASGQQVLNG